MQPAEPGAVRIVHLSDTHLTGDGALHQGSVDTAAALDAMLERLDALDGVDAVVVSGDCSEDGSAASYQALADRVGGWAERHGAALVAVPGNHDDRQGFRHVLGNGHLLAEGGARTARTLEERSPETPVSGVTTVRGLRIVTVDTSVPGAGWGVIGEESLRRLSEALADDAVAHPAGTVVVLHHPPLPAPSKLHDALRLRDTEALADRVRDAGVRAILAGHYHHHVGGMFAGVPVLVAPGVANDSDVLEPYDAESAFVGTGAMIVDLPEDGGLRWSVARAPRPGADDRAFRLDRDDVERIARQAGRGD